VLLSYALASYKLEVGSWQVAFAFVFVIRIPLSSPFDSRVSSPKMTQLTADQMGELQECFKTFDQEGKGTFDLC
jgi:hypothetical protein